MMNTKPKLGFLIAAALMSMTNAANAQAPTTGGDKFTPLEKLSLEERNRYEPLIRELGRTVRIDWDSVILGVDANGYLTLRSRKAAELDIVSQPSCWTDPF